MNKQVVGPFDESEDVPLWQLLEQVHDQASFLRFASALADEAERAEEMTRQRPTYYIAGGALDWQNLSVSSFLGGAMYAFENEDVEPNWKAFADFLYCGKIIE